MWTVKTHSTIHYVRGHMYIHTFWPGSLWPEPGKQWWPQWSSDLSPLPAGPALLCGRRSYSVRSCTGWGPNPNAWSTQTLDQWEKGRSYTNKIQNDQLLWRWILNLWVYHEDAGLFAIHESFGDSVSSQDLITTRRERQKEMLRKVYRNIIHSSSTF